MLSLSHQAVELIDGIGIVGNFVNVMMKSFGILEVEGKGIVLLVEVGNNVVLVVELGEEVIPLHAEFPGRPCYIWIVHVEVTVRKKRMDYGMVMVVVRGSRNSRECPVRVPKV